MFARKYSCTLIERQWLTPTVLALRFKPSKDFPYEGGQFLSLIVPSSDGKREVKRAYSFASAFGDDLCELCVRIIPGGRGSTYLEALKPGDAFKIFAAYGHFSYKPAPGRSMCMIATGSGVAPFRSMVRSQSFHEAPPEDATLIFGARKENEIIYPGFFESRGIQTVVAISDPGQGWKGFRGRVTDYLRTLPAHWAWHTTDFYICGNADMGREVVEILRQGHGVSDAAIFLEIFGQKKREEEGEDLLPLRRAA